MALLKFIQVIDITERGAGSIDALRDTFCTELGGNIKVLLDAVFGSPDGTRRKFSLIIGFFDGSLNLKKLSKY